jgi:hypothetical protein
MPLRVSTIGVEVPDDFPQSHYDAIHARVILSSPTDDSMFHFSGAWNAIAYRFISCARSDETFRASLQLAGTSTSHSERYRQEDSLFDFFVKGLAVIESFFYGLYWLGSMSDSAPFPILMGNGLRDITVDMTIKKYTQKLKTGLLVSSFGRIACKDVSNKWKNTLEYEEWKDVRNILAHRAAYGRVVNAGNAGNHLTEDLWKVRNIPFNAELTTTKRQWLASTLRDLMKGAEDFANSNL